MLSRNLLQRMRMGAVGTGTLSIVLTVVFSALVGCGNSDHDVSHNPSYGNFATVIGTWKTKVPLYLVQRSDTEKSLLISTDSADYVPGDGGLAVLPIGSELRIEHLMQDASIEATVYYVTGSLTSGPYGGKSASIDPELFINNGFIGRLSDPFPLGERGWGVVPEKLEK